MEEKRPRGNPNVREISKLITPEQRIINGRKGGLMKGENFKRRKEFKETLNLLLELPLTDKTLTNVENIKSFAKLKGKNVTVDQALMVKLIQKALNGDLNAITMIRDTIGEKPAEKVDMDAKITNNPLENLTTEELKALIKNNDSN